MFFKRGDMRTCNSKLENLEYKFSMYFFHLFLISGSTTSWIVLQI